MPSRNISRRSIGLVLPCITAASLRQWSPRGKSTIRPRSRRTCSRSNRRAPPAYPRPPDRIGGQLPCFGGISALSNIRDRCGRLPKFGRLMRFTSLIVELIRARPRLVVWLVVLTQAAMWVLLAMLLYRSPPGDVATVLAFGREYQVGTDMGPPLALWLADIAYRAAGNHVFGVYLLSQVCAVATFWTLYLLARSIVGGQQAVLAVLLTMTVTTFGSPGLEFGPLVLARPLWALLLLHSWQLIGQGRRNAWFGWSIEAGLLLLTSSAAIGLLLLIIAFALATARGRRMLMSFDPLFALLVIVVLALPYLVWLPRADILALPPWPAIADLSARALHWAALLGGPLLALSGIVLLPVLNSGWFGRKPEEAPIIYRPPVDPLARDFVY